MCGFDSFMCPSDDVFKGVRKSEPPFSKTTMGAAGARTTDACCGPMYLRPNQSSKCKCELALQQAGKHVCLQVDVSHQNQRENEDMQHQRTA